MNRWAVRILAILMLLAFALMFAAMRSSLVKLQQQQQQQNVR
jgi:hypothetical protein